MGKLVGAALRYQFFDTDQLIEAAASAEKDEGSPPVSVAEIFASEGEDAFREAETATLQALLPYTSVVVATGGGAVTKKSNWGLMQHGVVCWLDGPASLLASRAAKDGVSKRPLLQQQAEGEAAEASTSGGRNDESEQLTARLSTLLEKRREQYANADLRIPLVASAEASSSLTASLGASPALVAFRLLKALEKRIDGDAAAREEERKFEITGAGEVPKTMRVVPAKGGGAQARRAPAPAAAARGRAEGKALGKARTRTPAAHRRRDFPILIIFFSLSLSLSLSLFSIPFSSPCETQKRIATMLTMKRLTKESGFFLLLQYK